MQKVIIIKVPLITRRDETTSVIDVTELNSELLAGYEIKEIHQLNEPQVAIITFVLENTE